MTPNRIAAHLAISAMIGFAATSAHANLVTNGSFELGADGLQGWTLGGTDGGSPPYPPVAIFYGSGTPYPTGAFGEAIPVNNAPTNSDDPAGLRALYFVSDFANNQSVSQTIFLTAGIYQVGFSTYAPANGYANQVEAFFNGQLLGTPLASYAVSSGPATTWQTFTGAVSVATAGNYLVSFNFSTNGFPAKDIVVDQVYVIAGDPPINVPAPASLALLGIGLLGFGAMRMRRS